MELKQVILVRADLKLPKGKLAAQAAHAAVEAALKTEKQDKEKLKAWRSAGQKKIVLKVVDEQALFRFKTDAEFAGIITSLITDAGKTCIAPGTTTCLGLGPDDEEKIDKLTGELSMM